MPSKFKALTDIEEKEKSYVDSRVHDIEVAGQRARWIYAAIATVSFLLLSVAYNSVFSWSRSIAERLEHTQFAPSWSDKLNVELMRRWVESLHFDVPLLGAKFSASDAGIVGGVLLIFMAIWCFFSARRENHLVYYLVRDLEITGAAIPVKLYARTQLSATQIFAHGWHDEALVGGDIVMKSGHNKPVRRRPEDRLVRSILLGMFYLPAIALATVFATDIASLAMDSPFRPGDKSLWDFITDRCIPAGLFECEPARALLTRLSVSLVLVVLTLVIMHRAYRFQKGTSDIMKYTAQWTLEGKQRNGR